jgi:hypothetical protein
MLLLQLAPATLELLVVDLAARITRLQYIQWTSRRSDCSFKRTL